MSSACASESKDLGPTLMAVQGVGVAVGLPLVRGVGLLGVKGAPPALLGRVKELLHCSTDRY